MDTQPSRCSAEVAPLEGRRALLRSALAIAATGAAGGFGLLGKSTLSYAAALSKEERERLTPDDVLASLKRGNERFRAGKMLAHDYMAQVHATAAGQYPGAAILSCIDSRAPAEIILDARLGDLFNARVAGNVANDDVLGGLEFACALAGAKVILVMGHTSCGAVKGAIDNAELGHLTGLLARIKPAVAATAYAGKRSSKDAAFVDAVARSNVLHTLAVIRSQSSVLAGLEKDGKIKLAGSMYHLADGRVEFFPAGESLSA
jgi:carbonic anhydrase